MLLQQSGNTNIPFGRGSDEEMCIDFITYYPYLEPNKDNLAATQYCGFQAYGEFKGSNALKVGDDGMRIFGVKAGAADDPKCGYLSDTPVDQKNSMSAGIAHFHLSSYSCPEGYDCLFQNSCPSLFGAPCPPGYICTHPVDSKTSNFICPNDFDHRAKPTCTGADYDNDMDRGRFIAERCKEGQYCPNTSTTINCPGGTYCTKGSTKAEPCGGLVICSEGATFPISLAVLVVAIVYVSFYQLIAMCACGRNPNRSSSTVSAVGSENGNSPNEMHDGETQPAISGLEFQFEKLHLHKYGKDLLQNCSGKIRRGNLVAVMGPSG